MKTFKSFLILLMIAVTCYSTALAGNSDETQIRKVKGFNAIKVSTGIDLYLTMGDAEEVKVVADDDIIDDLVTEVENGTLKIYMKRQNWFNWGNGNETRKAYVTVKELEKLSASSGSDVETTNTIEGESLEVSCSSGSDVELDVHYKNLSVDTSSGSDAKLRGKVKTLKVGASSGSDIKAKDLESAICYADASSGSDITVSVSSEIYAHASSGADVAYYGDPEIRDTDESSGGDVHRR
ncbi:head GIN domain-containing protein [Draconibacterium sp. IB214405]|uniref:head GIN domain-containing protein n=1 Tax=Draconibacterium sp. IB214405 TaxID=3097352 RepID=UPI002A12BF8B|nr:head GIN domain-containing protein [Draconibacterium sp. IB214405]MDX8338082.1 head GIN domain-containing protein [Draconibacterium sp. IB214405]